ncbi:nicotinamide riboside transporter PnuC [Brumimicrobium mesophilum]|uniref:nicotinamide riboside transporter PnuC n=1 Tax=Brumimicrobium mesophilum TaxID=392717 RepID=UPI000D140B53|nr:nicotinamide riboside transporter PnuC [Brumimicrobium mesophilum]
MEWIYSSLTSWQVIGTAFGITQVLLARKNNVNNYLFGLVSIIIGIWVRFRTKLYGDILLDLYYLVMSIYGYFYWKFGKNKKQAPIAYSNKKEHIKAISIVMISFILILIWLKNFTNSDVPYWDATTSAFAFAGMWLMAKRKIENWVYLNISNFISLPLLIYKELYIYAGLTAFLFIVAISGYIKWRKIIKNEERIVDATN